MNSDKNIRLPRVVVSMESRKMLKRRAVPISSILHYATTPCFDLWRICTSYEHNKNGCIPTGSHYYISNKMINHSKNYSRGSRNNQLDGFGFS